MQTTRQLQYCREESGFFHEKVNWDEVLAKRPRRNKWTHWEHEYPHVVERALAVISNVEQHDD
jgi:hypothetical protein